MEKQQSPVTFFPCLHKSLGQKYKQIVCLCGIEIIVFIHISWIRKQHLLKVNNNLTDIYLFKVTLKKNRTIS